MRIINYRILIIISISIIFFPILTKRNSGKDLIKFSAIIKNIPSPHDKFIKDYDKFIINEIDSTQTVGAAIAIVCHDSLIYLKTFGVRKVGTNDSINVNTIFRLASVSKGFAGVLACILHNDSIIDLDKSISCYLPGFSLKDTLNSNLLTLRHTLSHTSGLVPHSFDNLIEDNLSLNEILNRLKEVEISASPGEIYAYQNAIFSLIDSVLIIKTGKNYNQHLKERIFMPLNMNNASSTFEGINFDSNVAYPHRLSSDGFKLLKLNEGYYNVSPAAGINASISDMSKWLKAMLGEYTDVVDTSVLRMISTPEIYTPLRRKYTWRWGTVKGRYYSLGWRIYNYNKHNIVYHGGYVKGYRAEIAFCPEEKTGIVFLQNSPNRLASESIPEFWKRYFAVIDTKDQN